MAIASVLQQSVGIGRPAGVRNDLMLAVFQHGGEADVVGQRLGKGNGAAAGGTRRLRAAGIAPPPGAWAPGRRSCTDRRGCRAPGGRHASGDPGRSRLACLDSFLKSRWFTF